jgi:putative transposase
MRYAFIQRHAVKLPVRTMCRLLAVQASGYYAWTGRRAPCAREARRLQLIESIRLVHGRSHGTYGSPRVHQALKKQGVICSRKRVEKLMRQEQVRSTRHRRFRVRTTDGNHGHPLAANLLDRQFRERAVKLNQTWVSDLTYVATDEGWLYVASVMDLCSRRIIGWSTAGHLRSELAEEALEKAIRERCPAAGLLHHSDRGVQYACGDYQAILARRGITCSMSRSGNCYDNASIESFFKTFKVELVYQARYATREEARRSVHSYIEVFYNRQRLHSSLGYRSPAEYEAELGQKRTRRAHV